MTDQINIRRAGEEDANMLSEMICKNAERLLLSHYSHEQWKVFIKYYSAEILKERFSRQVIFCGEINNKIIGTIALEKDFVVGFYTHPDYINNGLGSVLMLHLERYAHQQGLKKIRLTASPVGLTFYYRRQWRKVRDIKIRLDDVEFRETLMEKELDE